MKNTFLILTVLILSSTIFLACDKQDEITGVNTIMPIKVGNNWKYTIKYKNNTDHVDTSEIKIVGPITIDGKDYFAMDYLPSGENEFNEKQLYGNDESGNLVTYGAISTVDSLIQNPGKVMLKCNPTLNEVLNISYFNLEYVNENEGIQIIEEPDMLKCISTDTLISTPKGSFHCIAFESEGSLEESCSRVYYARNIGLVRTEYIESEHVIFYRELIDYTLH